LKLMTRPWDFLLEDIPGPVLLWHGNDDFDVPVILGKAVARRLPRCEAHFVPHQGHVWVLEHFEEVLIGLSRLIEVTCR
jgi:pimeloyl-ACP methyl ester carboxylesterase